MLKSLNVAQSGLSAAKIAVENVSNNIANENTPGYKKRVVQLSEMDIADTRFTGRGVKANEAYRITSEYMFNNIMRENTKSNYYEEVSSIVGNVEQMFKETETSGFSKDLNRFFQAVENLRSNPNSEIYRTTLKTEGTVLVDSLQNLYSALEAQEEITYNRLEDNVDEINSILHDIGKLNEQMGQFNSVSNDLLDKRDQLERELSSLIDIEVDRSEGDYQLKIGGEVAVRHNVNIKDVNLVEENVTQLDRFTVVEETATGSNVYDAIKFDENYEARTFNTGDVITYKFDNNHEVSVTIGEDIFTPTNPPQAVDLGSGSNTVTADTIIRALEYKINHHTYISEKVQAYNGNYETDEDGNKVDETSSDKFLLIESKVDGTDGSFEGRITISRANNPAYETTSDIPNPSNVDIGTAGSLTLNVEGVDTSFNIPSSGYTYDDLVTDINSNPNFDASIVDDRIVINHSSGKDISITGDVFNFSHADTRNTIFKNDYQSIESEDKVYLAVYDSEINVSSGLVKAQIENLSSEAPNNKIVDYKNKLDDFAKTLSDIYDKYVESDNETYLYGHITTDNYDGSQNDIKHLNLFSGSSVKNLTFNENSIADLAQSDLDYLSKMQWKKDIDFDGFAQDGSTQTKTSFSEFYQETRVNISSDKENNDFLLETQTTVVASLQNSYDQLTKVDSDEEMVNLIQFQAAYTANAKIITVVDEMLQTLLNIR